MSVFRIVTFTCLAISGLTLNAEPSPVVWTGRVVDARTGAAAPGVACYGGGRGRVDLTAKAITGSNGDFTVVYENALDLSFWEYYAIDATDPTETYFHYRRAQVSPQPLLIRLVPKRAFIQGTVRDANTGQPLAGANVSLARPGAILRTVTAGPDGSYSFNPDAYDGSYNNETIPAGEEAGVPSVYANLARPITNYSLRVSASGYRLLKTDEQNVTIGLKSSVTDAIHTRVDVNLAPDAAPAGMETATAQLVEPPARRITSASLLNGTVGVALSYQITANTAPTSFSASSLPLGLSLDSTTGLISGMPTEAGMFTADLSATGAEATAQQRLTIVIQQPDGVVFDNNNIWGVSSGPPAPPTFTVAEATRITYIMDYHYFNGGVLPGTIALQHEDGTTYGPWQAAGRIGQGGVQNAYWEAWPCVVLKPGTYTVADSHPPTWSYNAQSDHKGITTIRGSAAVANNTQILATWAQNHGLVAEAALANSDPDGDNQPNWVELAIGNNPALPDLPPTLSLRTPPSGPMKVEWPVCTGGIGVPGSEFVVNGARMVIEVAPSPSAETWDPASELLDLANALHHNHGNGRETLSVPLKSVPGTAWFIRQRFLRVED